jgi:hypothetical protein
MCSHVYLIAHCTRFHSLRLFSQHLQGWILAQEDVYLEHEHCAYDNMIDNIFWLMGFKTEKQAEKVIIYIICIMYSIVIIFIILTGSYRARSCGSRAAEQKRCYCPVCAWYGRSVSPFMREGWLSYIKQAYPDGAADWAGPVLGQDTLIVQN